jgi:hypothetical protein
VTFFFEIKNEMFSQHEGKPLRLHAKESWMWIQRQLFHWPSLIFYESIASCDVQSVVDYEEVTLVEVNPQRKSKTSCKEFKYDLVLNLIHLKKFFKTKIKYCTSNKPIDYIFRSTML